MFTMSTDTETSCEHFLISLGQYQQEFHDAPRLVSQSCALPSKHELWHAGLESIFKQVTSLGICLLAFKVSLQ